MLNRTIRVHTLFAQVLLCFPALLASCGGQPTSKTNSCGSAITPGDTVRELSKSIWVIFQASGGDYWFGSDTEGIYRFDGKTLLHYSTKHGLSSNRIRDIQEDKQGNIYCSTLGGINKFDGYTFTALSPIKSDSATANWKLQAGDLWFSVPGKNGEKGPYRYDGTNLYQLEFPKHYLEDDYYKRFPGTTLSPYEVYCIYKDNKGTMWFGTGNFGICHYDGKSFSWLYEDHLSNTPAGGSFGIRSILQDTKGEFWFCNSRYRFRISSRILNLNDRVLIDYQKEKGIEDIKSADGADHFYFQSIAEDKDGDLWMATYNEGVWRYNGKEVKHYIINDGTEGVKIIKIYKDHKNNIWIGTQESGVFKYNGNAFEQFKL